VLEGCRLLALHAVNQLAARQQILLQRCIGLGLEETPTLLAAWRTAVVLSRVFVERQRGWPALDISSATRSSTEGKMGMDD
jgi:hypothetical protein